MFNTSGNFNTEKEAEDFFDSIVCQNPNFIIERQVKGRRLFDANPVDSGKNPNGQNIIIDRIIYPKESVISEGWLYGPIGVEIKRTGVSVGAVLTQILEQKQTIYRSKVLNGARIMPLMFALFEAADIVGDIASILDRQSILLCSYDERKKHLKFSTPSYSAGVICIGSSTFSVRHGWKPSTNKGHQGG